ncbi:hypothetical protein AB0J42_12080 [Nonomuraea sp. NPDC049649]|uniref:hypothetical protein n=1 Tax=Nonomuraea sp. NPDC049649 TaxID=3155776 RepID=UPI0034327DE6
MTTATALSSPGWRAAPTAGTATRNAAPAQPMARRPVEMVAKTAMSAGAGQKA